MNTDFDMPARPARFAPMAVSHGSGSDGVEGNDWHRLRSRLAAARGADARWQQANPCNPALSVGSFDRSSARMLADYGIEQGPGQDGVNSTALGRGNSRCGNDADIAGANSVGDRG
jgi:hypothetical protein